MDHSLPEWAVVLMSVLLGALGHAWLAGGGRGGRKRGSKQRSLLAQQQQLVVGAQEGSGGDSEDDSDDEVNALPSSGIRDWGIGDGPFKLVLVVNMELKMGKGKVAAQCSHATLGCYKRARQHAYGAVKSWEYLGQAKICLKCEQEAEMWDIKQKAEAAGLATYMVMDAGRTQIASGSRTVLGIGPAPESSFLGITDHLKLM